MCARPVRRTQAIAPFGPGAMVDFPGPVSLIHCGIDAWPFSEEDPSHEEFKIADEPRLAAQLNIRYFVQPPDFRLPARGASTQQHNLNLRLPFLRFPKWHVCPRCGRMFEGALHDVTAPMCSGPIGSGKSRGQHHNRRRTIQVRFIAACEHGHLQDFPWWEWIFRTPTPEREGRRLRMMSAGTSSLAGVRIVCEEDTNDTIQVVERGSLRGAFHFEVGQSSPFSKIGVVCRGENPALGIPSATQSAPGCGHDLYPLLRGGSNVYFPHVKSAIYLPTRDAISQDEVLEILEDHRVWSHLSLSAEADPNNRVTEQFARAALNRYYPDRSIATADLMDAANRRLDGGGGDGFEPVASDTPEIAFRREEFDLLSRDVEEGYSKTNLLVRRTDIASYESPMPEWFSQVSLVHKLRETRAFVGFSRIYPASSRTSEEERSLLAREPKDWLPAVVVRGEGIFLQLREERIADWLDTCGLELEERIGRLTNTWGRLRAQRQLMIHQQPSPRFVLLHTFSHLLINQLVFECGYGTASLRERIYCADGDHPMAAVLVYTAAGDSEGSMGGLVRMGRPGRLEPAVRRALDKATWCSSDPVCMESGSQGPDGCNLAACHSCALVPETTCEEQNRLLDRGVVIGTLQSPKSGFFNFAD